MFHGQGNNMEVTAKSSTLLQYTVVNLLQEVIEGLQVVPFLPPVIDKQRCSDTNEHGQNFQHEDVHYLHVAKTGDQSVQQHRLVARHGSGMNRHRRHRRK